MNYGDLKAELTACMFHPRHVARYDTATHNFEAAANRRLRVLDMEAVTNLTTVSGECPVPSDYLQWRTVQWTSTSPWVDLDYVHPAYLRSTWIETDNGRPKVFTIEGDTFKTRPVDDSFEGYEFHYYQQIPTIVDTSNILTNWLLTKWPDAYIFGAVTELFALQRNREAAELWKARRDEVFAEIIRLSSFTTGATSPQVRQAGEYF